MQNCPLSLCRSLSTSFEASEAGASENNMASNKPMFSYSQEEIN